MCPGFDTPIRNHPSIYSLRFQGILVLALLLVLMFGDGGASCLLSIKLVWSCIIVVGMGGLLTYRDADRERFGYISRVLYMATALTLTIPMTIYYYKNRSSTFSGDEIVVNTMGLYVLLALGESIFVPTPGSSKSPEIAEDGSILPPKPNGGKLSTFTIATLLKPYVWPDETADSAVTNRIRASMTWVCVIASKACNLSAPVLVSWLSFVPQCCFFCGMLSLAQFFVHEF
jgi:hypothetical protein